MAEKPSLAAVPERLLADDYIDRLRENFGAIVKEYGKTAVSRYTGISDETLTKLQKSRGDGGRLRTFLELASYMDIPPAIWFLPHNEFLEAVAKRGPNPFFAPARSQGSSASGLTGSGVRRDRYGKIKKGKAASRREGSARCVHFVPDLHEDDRAA